MNLGQHCPLIENKLNMEEKKVVYITGGSKGIGKGIAAYLLEKGYKIAISGRNLESVQKTATILDKTGENVLAIESDVTRHEDEERAVKTILEKWGKIDVLVANAGLGVFASIDELSHDQWNKVINTNVTGVFNSVKATVEALKKTKGYIITIASLAGANFFPKGSAYNASKFAIVGFSQAIMLDLRPFNIKVSTIMPGTVTSHFNNHIPNEEDTWKIQPEDIGQIVYDLLQMNPRTLPSKIEVRPSNPILRPNSAPQ